MYNFKLTEGPRHGLSTLFDPGQRRSDSGDLLYSQYVSDDLFWVLNILRTWKRDRPPSFAASIELTNVGEHFIGSEYLNSSKVFLKRNITFKSEKDIEQKSQAWANGVILKINKKIFASDTNFSKSSLKRLNSNILSDRLFHGHTPERDIALDYVERFASDLESEIFGGSKEESLKSIKQFARFIGKNEIYRTGLPNSILPKVTNIRPILSDRMSVLADRLEHEGAVKRNPAKNRRLRSSETDIKPTLIVSRHPTFVKYLIKQGLVDKNTKVVDHATIKAVRGQHVIGVLPSHIAVYAASVTEVPMRLTMADRKIMQNRDLSIERIHEIAGKPITYWIRPNSEPPITYKKRGSKDLIFQCQNLWTKYYNRPTKKNLNSVFEHLEKMKSSKNKKVLAERTRCLRVANKERLKFARSHP